MSKKTCVMYLCAAVAACVAVQVRAEGLTAPRLSLDPSVLTLADAASQPEADNCIHRRRVNMVSLPFPGS